MTTHSLIARPTDAGFQGQFVQGDGDPDHQVPLLLGAYQNRFAGDLTALQHYLIDEHPAGWSYLGRDLADDSAEAVSLPAEPHSSCYCHDFGDPAVPPLDQDTVADSFVSWIYILREVGLEAIELPNSDWDRASGLLIAWDCPPTPNYFDGAVALGKRPYQPTSGARTPWRPNRPPALLRGPAGLGRPASREADRAAAAATRIAAPAITSTSQTTAPTASSAAPQPPRR